jgi:hypothetical protein
MTTTKGGKMTTTDQIRYIREGICYICGKDIAWGATIWVHPTGVMGHIGHTQAEFEARDREVGR